MTVILMLAMFAIFLTIDYLRHRKDVPHTAQGREEAAALSPRGLPSFIAGFELPDNRRYHPGHTWALQESPTLVRVGIDDFGARLAGKLDGLVLPKRGQWLRQGQKFATIIRDSQRTDLVSPIEGEVTNVNEALNTSPEQVNKDAHGAWMIKITLKDPAEADKLLSAADYEKFAADEAGH